MRPILRKAATAFALTIALTACGDQAPVAEPVADEIEAPLDASEAETDGSTEVEGDVSTNGGGSDQMVGGSNNDAGARKPDPKRSKLIKADPD